MTLTGKNIVLNIAYYGVTAVGLPAIVLAAENRFGLSRKHVPALRLLAVGLALAGIALQLWCITLFQRKGGGTPSPVWPPTRLVVAGAYRWVRNPMNLGEVLVFFALAAWFDSWVLVLYALLAWLTFHLYVVVVEEPKLARRFNECYDSYRRRVARWLPKFPPAGQR